MFVHGLATNPGWDWPTFFQFFTTPTIFSALWGTIQLTVYGTVLCFALGAVVATMRLSSSPFLQVVAWGYIWAFRSIPLIVQLLFWFNIAYLYQELSLGIPFGPEFVHFSTNNHEDNGWDRILFAYHSGAPDPAQVAAYVASRTEKINLVVAHRPNVAYPTLTAKTFATLDRISGGRFEVHVIIGGSTADQAAEGAFLSKDDRYGRTQEFIQILKQAWTSESRFDFAGKHYRLRPRPGRRCGRCGVHGLHVRKSSQDALDGYRMIFDAFMDSPGAKHNKLPFAPRGREPAPRWRPSSQM